MTEFIPIEIKAAMTITDSFFKGLIDWHKISKQEVPQSYIVYAGNPRIVRTQGIVVGWNSIKSIVDEI